MNLQRIKVDLEIKMKKITITLLCFFCFSYAQACMSENTGVGKRQLVKAWIYLHELYEEGNINALKSMNFIHSGMSAIEKDYVKNFNVKLNTTSLNNRFN